MMDTSEIKSVIQNYFDASYEGSGDKMSTVFHSVAHIYGHGEGGALRDMEKESFVKLVGSHGAPKPDYKRQDEILAIDFTGENTAVARVKLRVGNTLFTDILSFMRLDNKWAVIAKVFSGVPVS
jgi:hypothetical protein